MPALRAAKESDDLEVRARVSALYRRLENLSKAREGDLIKGDLLAEIRPKFVFFPDAEEVFQPGDQLLAVGKSESLERMLAVQSLEIVEENEEGGPTLEELTEGVAEVTLSPQSKLAGKTLRELDLRGHYGLAVLAIWRRDRSFRSHLSRMRLQFGDALLLSGSPDKIESAITRVQVSRGVLLSRSS